jgi:tetratricopeptide (TPR) repeat protein
VDKYQEIELLADGPDDKLKKAWVLCHELLLQDPLDAKALINACFVGQRLGLLGPAYHLGRSATQLYPKEANAWINFGYAAAQLWRTEESEGSYYEAMKIAKANGDIKTQTYILLNLGALYLDLGLFDRGRFVTEKLLEADPNNSKALSNLAICRMGQGDWDGWSDYRRLIGTPYRPKVTYRGEPEWDGTPDKTVVLYAEQGLGDEILFASMIPDAAKLCRKLIFDCDGRLEGLFKRSFPQIKVYGTRVKEEKWDKADRAFDCSLAVGQVGEYVRPTHESFPRQAYLKACPIRRKQWLGLHKKPTVGIAWSGGVSRTGAKIRRAGLEDWLPLFKAVDAKFVSLQYKDAQEEIDAFLKDHPGVDLVQYPWATLTHDYDDTAALVSTLDCVIGVPTSVIHLSGALGVKTFAMKAEASCWKYSSGLLFHPCDLIEHKGTWEQTIQSAVPLIRAHLGSLSATTPASPSLTTSSSTRSSVTQAVRSALPRSSSGSSRLNGAG